MYDKIAKFYDRLGWKNYSERLWKYMLSYFKEINFNPRTHLDIACGTGILCINAMEAGIKSEGLDISIHMVRKAIENAKDKNMDINFIQEDMRSFEMNKKYDLITCTYDAINHLLTLDEWLMTFSNVKKHLNYGGIFIFDCNTLKALRERWNGFHMQKDSNGNYIIQKAIFYEDKGQASATFTVFIKEDGRLYDGFEETFTEAAFYSEDIIDALNKAGFTEVSITNMEFKMLDEPDGEYRNVYVCK
ncbi:hypothetical protein TR13x_03155 [Caloranaerobacter sp. TR13]|uniref:class I SAM-dependent DNA methyltransferase n=1 Tax=Caloranaerobacter sp. TR13 TaxID=1302151 RepID=UPI0006D3ED0B|nr:class I SAM-dependent methyltransferase [Caloranaerobacter sp. TR13]KPU28346.1 hypothetical protein TR13x_03155 [Caloranaerobacter sp. TR13]